MANGRAKSPSYPWYPRDYEFDEEVKLMSYEQEGIYRRLLDHQWFHAGIPMDPKQIALLVPKVSPRRFLVLWHGIASKFHEADGRLVNPKLERVRAEWDTYRSTKSHAGQKGAASRWHKHDKPNSKPMAVP